MTDTLIGYARCSTDKQDLTAQRRALIERGVPEDRIYMDPPYNTGGKDWVYNDHYIDKNDRYRHSTWLEFLYSQLTLVRDLLTNGGVILVSINDENRAKLELLMDEALPSMRISSFRWRTRVGGMAAKGAPTQRSLAAHGRALTPMVNNPGQRAHRAVRENL